MFLAFNISWLAWLERLGGLGLILLGLADNSVVPLPGSMDAATVVLAAHEKTWWWYYAVMAIIGAVIGGYATYELGRKGGREALEKKLPHEKAERVYRAFAKYGFLALFVPALLPPPVPFTPFLIAAGALNYPRRKFLVAVGVARAIRYFALGYLGSIYSEQIFGFLREYYQPILWTAVALAVIGGVVSGIYVWRCKRRGKPVIPDSKAA